MKNLKFFTTAGSNLKLSKMRKNIAIIPVRIGSKRLPKKNIKIFHGRPIFLYMVDCALKSGLFDEVHVSTESNEVFDMCKSAKIAPKFMRPKYLAHDEATLEQVCEFTLNEYKKYNIEFDNFCLLWATAPMTLPSDLIDSYNLLENVDAVVSTCEYDFPFFSGHELLKDNYIKPIFPDMLHGNIYRPTIVCVNSSLCWVKTNEFFKQKTWLPRNLKSYNMPRNRSSDINTFDDWYRAEYLYEKFISK